MTYKVILLPRARRQLLEATLWWAENRSRDQAIRWLAGFEAALESLAHVPEIWPIAPEAGTVGFEIREMIYGIGRKKTHRAIFEIHRLEVTVYAIRHLAQARLTSDNL